MVLVSFEVRASFAISEIIVAAAATCRSLEQDQIKSFVLTLLKWSLLIAFIGAAFRPIQHTTDILLPCHCSGRMVLYRRVFDLLRIVVFLKLLKVLQLGVVLCRRLWDVVEVTVSWQLVVSIVIERGRIV